jgi:hypothetical protein
VLAQFDDESIVVYQAYRPSIGHYAIKNGRLGGPDFSFQRMSWVKPNFLWMMYRSGWGTKQGQEVTLGLRIRRTFFDRLLAEAVPSTNAWNWFNDDDHHPTRQVFDYVRHQCIVDSLPYEPTFV